jgi:hypothetical protein
MLAQAKVVITQSQIDWHNTIIYSIIATLVAFVVFRIIRALGK